MSEGRGSYPTIAVDAAAATAKNEPRDCFIAPQAARWSTGLSPLIIMITR